ncbi:flagellar hook-length control protein FliK [Candidatus Methylospira mobilis]|nr:flagellar hook-length control protein FliK [Candidatus Methylospira mobilis]WNV06739.1 flagellar hook-length control protein FliK [Candidatus Methylospira mobilis]
MTKQADEQSGVTQSATTPTAVSASTSPADMTPVSRATAIAALMDSVASMVGSAQVSGSATNAAPQNKNPATQNPGDGAQEADAANKQNAVATALPPDAVTIATAALQNTALSYQQTTSGKTAKTASEQTSPASLEGNSAVSSASLKAAQATQPLTGLSVPVASTPAPGKASVQNAPAANNSLSQATTPTDRNAVMADSSASSESAAVQNAASIVQHMASTEANTPSVATATTHQVGVGLNAQQTDGMVALGTIVPQSQINASSVVSGASDSLRPPVGSQDWNTALSQQVAWMANSQQQTATLTLNPPDLGPMRIVLNLSDNTHQLGASFLAAHPETRAALEAAMPRLREMLDSAGIQLGQTSVGSGDTPSSNWAGNNRPQSQSQSFFSGDNGELVTGVETLVTPQINQQSAGIGLIDTHV